MIDETKVASLRHLVEREDEIPGVLLTINAAEASKEWRVCIGAGVGQGPISLHD